MKYLLKRLIKSEKTINTMTMYEEKIINFLQKFIGWYWKSEVASNDRVQTALNVRKNSVNDFFGGWEERDLKLLSSYQLIDPIIAASGEIVDWLGIRTAARLHAWLPIPPNGSVSIHGLPVPD